jgi:hypothetical protein
VKPLPDRQERAILIRVPPKPIDDQRRFRRIAWSLRVGSIAVGWSRPRQHRTGLPLVPPTAAGSLGDARAFGLGNRPANRPEELILGIIGERSIDERDATAMTWAFLHQEHLMDVVPGQTIGVGEEEVIALSEGGAIAERVESGASESRSRIAIVAKDTILGERPRAIRRELPEAIALLIDGLGRGRTRGRDPHGNRHPQDRTPDAGVRMTGEHPLRGRVGRRGPIAGRDPAGEGWCVAPAKIVS